jgi:hypothetical protein
VADIE